MLSSLSEFITNPAIKVSRKVGTLISVFFLILIIDNVMGFTFYYNNHKKLEELTLIDNLKNSKVLSNVSLYQIEKMESEINTRKNIPGYLYDLAISIKDTEFNVKKYLPKDEAPSEKVNYHPTENPPRNNLILYLCSSWIFIMSSFIILVETIKKILKSKDVGLMFKDFVSAVFVIGMIILISLIPYYLLGKIPIIGKNWSWNYVLIFFAPIIVGLIFNAFTNKKNK